MRLKLSLDADKNSVLSPNYNYPLSAAIYNLLRFGSPEFSKFLHDIGFRQNGRTYKLFCFALKFDQIKISDGLINMISPKANLYITSPLIDDFIKNFVIGTFEEQKIKIYSNYRTTEFRIAQMELVPNDFISEETKFLLHSPMVLSTVRKYEDGKMVQYYLRPDDKKEINRIITSNLLSKYKLIYGKELTTDELELEWDQQYLSKHERVTKKITINESDKNSVDVIGIQAPFMLKGNPKLIKVGYDCGFGEKNSMGFGFAVPHN
ncbi:MAG: CRISPR-associated endoribonuclease Cas6 [Ignavibacteria bacterium RIFOXYB2_FULL_35_12]|nr:MAG: CRISPR-associated endoribonuclease Cas6 [Ignavibacteria bacterium GWA2_36_19]OGU56286.1 MAG: CRISPR-associated endoribonuclease Cas6 [Ignavibacteria bacterium GWF2_35_20]OGU78781.1 MAG: CRISPR-associated endoribonuclease Cas6 [Ignavibacteria bacterium RIFOXYA2_FULL_35_9]OGU88181.1 MAG: CRISPR-associated endoribonuclease Cas6 [Ignavibacteria bacterium RIFOXYA12_FULL_35_25]OGU95990.1 MAG: CRISPR-associated endoribonuclease Cas6 [Ignavibacteria bacterium RIFOXYB12_FULL_35_14]OGU99353.1 MA